MLTRLLAIGTLTVAILSSHAHADIMHWFWEVEVNGQAVDATVPVVVGAGDQVDIELWAEWEPHRWGLAEAVYAINTSDQFFGIAESVDISEANGFGRNSSFGTFDNFNGEFIDTDGSGTFDSIDLIWMSQLPPLFGHDDQSNPLRAYSLRWILADTPHQAIQLQRGPTFNDYLLINRVYTAPEGGYADYDAIDDSIIFIPVPPSSLVLLPLVFMQTRRRR